MSDGASEAKTKVALWRFAKTSMGILYAQNYIKKKTLLEIAMLGCWGEVACVYPSRLFPNPYLISGVTRTHVGQSLLKLSITDLYAYRIFVESLRYKVLIFCLCRS